MLTLDATTLVKTNSAEVKTFYLYEITYQTGLDPLRWTNWSENVVFEGHTFEPRVIKHSDITQSSDGKLNDITLNIGNVDRAIQYYIENFEIMDHPVRIVQVFDGCVGYVEATFDIKAAQANSQQVTFTLSVGVDYLKASVPGRVLRSKYCWWAYGDASCKMNVNPGDTCDRTFETCRAKGNLINFGGFPGIINERFYF